MVNLTQKNLLCLGLLFSGHVTVPNPAIWPCVNIAVLGTSLGMNLLYFTQEKSREDWNKQKKEEGTKDALRSVTRENDPLNMYGDPTCLKLVALAESLEPGFGRSKEFRDWLTYNRSSSLRAAMIDEHYFTLAKLFTDFQKIRQRRQQNKYYDIVLVSVFVYTIYGIYKKCKKNNTEKTLAEQKTIVVAA